MILIVCVDEKKGMMFHHRRQSQDRILREDMIKQCRGKKLYMNEYSAAMFGECADESIIVSEDFLYQAGENDYCFVENQQISSFLVDINKMILYYWNRRYPADTYFTVDLEDGTWELEKRVEFTGSSHEKITKEVYKKVQ